MSEIALRTHALPEPASRAAQAERPVFVVVGMHRSGTSLCANALGLMGVDMADEAGPCKGNELGHFERWDVVGLQDEALALFDRGYFSPTHDFPLPPAWWADFRVRPIRERLKGCLEAILARGGLVGFKDPRTTRLMPMWNQIFAELRLRPRFVVCLRNPAHVAISLQTRDGLDPQTGELRALDYMVDALRHTRGRDRCFIQYEEWIVDPLPNARKLLDFVGSEIHVEPREFEIAVQSIVRPEANRSGLSGQKPRQPLVRSFYDLVDQFVATGGADASLDASIETFTHSYIAFRQLLGPFETQFKKVAAAREELERALCDARNSLEAEKEAAARQSAESDRRSAELTAALQAAQAECAIQAEQHAVASRTLAEVTQALEAERTASAQLSETLAATQASARQTLAEAEGRGAELAAALQEAQADCAHVVEQYASISQLLAETMEALDAERASAARLGETQASIRQALAESERMAAGMAAALQEAQADRARLAEERATVIGQLAQSVQALGLERPPADEHPAAPVPAAQA
ncbi:hypothetical protein ACNHKD_13315 [Methylocystis sp. JAN1]|uniref:sulfotransferase family protein n=1 Tax=Methylocystis sp. JAN1 TaxID=3397211 RepID=UPI003FA2DAD1